MKIKRFVAPDMRTALRMVRDEHGADAVILSNRRTEEGIEIVAASNYDEALVQQALDSVRPSAPTPPVVTPPATNPAPRPAAEGAPSLATAVMAAISRRHSPARAAGTAPAATAVPAPAAATAASAAPVRAPAGASSPDIKPFAEFMLPHEVLLNAPEQVQPQAAAVHAASPATQQVQATPAIATPAPLPTQVANPIPAPVATSPAQAPVAMQAPLAAVPAPPPAQSDAQLAQLRDELALMRQMIEREMNRLTDERLRGSPVRAQALELMDDYGFDAGLTRDVVMQIPANAELHRGRGLMLGLLSRRLPIAPTDPLEEGGVIALVGPTGAGKTTTIAKLASRFLERHAARDVALVTTDTIRVGGREQLHSYGRQLGIAVHEADSDAGLQQLLQRLGDYKLVLIDTAGMGQRDRALAAQLNWLRGSRIVRCLLVLPANAHFSDLDEVVRRFAGAAPQGVILTKLDETGRFGSVLSVVVDHQLPITWVTDGQHVPNDLHRANAPSLVLRLEDLRRDADKPCTPEQTHAVA